MPTITTLSNETPGLTLPGQPTRPTMFSDINSEVSIVGGFIILAFVLFRVILYTRRKGGNAELWGTIFEGLTHYVQPQETLKEPKQYINKEKKQSGEGYDDED